MEPVLVSNNEPKEKPSMTDTMLKDATKAGERFVHGLAASREAVAKSLEDGTTAVRHFAKRTRNTVNELVDDAAHNIKRYPFRSVAVGLGVGMLVGVLIARNGRR